MRTSELGFFPPFLVDRRVSRVARLKEGLDEPCGCRGGDVESECGEDEWGCEAAGTYLLGDNVDKTSYLLKSEHDVALVREIAIILGDFALLGVEAGWVQVEREETAVRDLGEIFLVVGVGGADGSGPCRLVPLVLLGRSGEGGFGTEGSGSSAELVCAVGGLGQPGGRGCPRPGEERGH